MGRPEFSLAAEGWKNSYHLAQVGVPLEFIDIHHDTSVLWHIGVTYNIVVCIKSFSWRGQVCCLVFHFHSKYSYSFIFDFFLTQYFFLGLDIHPHTPLYISIIWSHTFFAPLFLFLPPAVLYPWKIFQGRLSSVHKLL